MEEPGHVVSRHLTPQQPAGLAKKSASFMGFGRIAPAPTMKNIDKLKQKSARNVGAEDLHYKPKVSQTFLQNWLDYPVDQDVNVAFNSLKLLVVWLRWTNRAMAGLDPLDKTIRARVCNQLQVLGTTSSLFLVISVASFLVPPDPREEHDHYLVNVFGCLMFTASICLILYIALALTAIYPLVESLRDDIAFDAFEHYQRRLGGSETYLFFAGMILVLVAMLMASRIEYTYIAVFVMGATTVATFLFVLYLLREVFLALDPISSMHLGLSNDPAEQYRAELLSHFILRKVPNNLIIDGDVGKEVFEQTRESAKLEHTRASQKLEPKTKAKAKKRLSVYAELSRRAEEERGGGDYDVGFCDLGSARDGGPLTVVSGDVFRRGKAALPEGDGMVVPFALLEDNAQHLPTQSQTTLTAARSEVYHYGVRKVVLPALRDLCCHPDNHLFKTSGLSLADSEAVYACIAQAGCSSTEQLLLFLKEAKEYRPCTCSRDSSADAGSPAHSDQCSSRRAGAWAASLAKLGVPYFHAMQVVQALRPYL